MSKGHHGARANCTLRQDTPGLSQSSMMAETPDAESVETEQQIVAQSKM